MALQYRTHEPSEKIHELQHTIPWDQLTEFEKFHYIRKLLSKINEMEQRIENLELRNAYLDRG